MIHRFQRKNDYFSRNELNSIQKILYKNFLIKLDLNNENKNLKAKNVFKTKIKTCINNASLKFRKNNIIKKNETNVV